MYGLKIMGYLKTINCNNDMKVEKIISKLEQLGIGVDTPGEQKFVFNYLKQVIRSNELQSFLTKTKS